MTAAPGQVFKQLDWAKFREFLDLESNFRPQDIKRLSDIYIAGEGSPKVWNEPPSQKAYLNYFFPLNLMRSLHVLAWAKEAHFFSDFNKVIEFGSGPGTGQIAFNLSGINLPWHIQENSKQARLLHHQICAHLGIQAPIENPPTDKKKTLFVSSYTLSESELPPVAYECDALFLLEDSTHETFKKLSTIRTNLIRKGFYIWAPCTHQLDCPLVKTKGDWCHFRVPFEKPDWFENVEAHLPMKNQSLTLSYLIARRKAPETLSNRARIIGTTLYEKGKTRQSVCRNSDREFLSWLTRDGEVERIESGALIELPKDIMIKGNEIRMPSPKK